MFTGRLVSPLLAAGMAMCVLSTATAQQTAVAAITETPAGASRAEAAQPALTTVDEVRSSMASGAKIIFLDSRSTIAGDMIDGAGHVTVANAEAWAKDMRRDAVIVTYCACASEGGSKALAAKLASLGFTNVKALRGGINAWKAAGLPTQIASR